MKRLSVAVRVLALNLGYLGAVQAQLAPDAGTLRQQIESQQAVPLPRQTLPSVQPATEPLKDIPGVTTIVTSIRFVGNKRLTTENLGTVVQRYLNKPHQFAQLQEAADAVTNAYRDAGWLVRAYLPKQDLTNGVLTIQIVEALFGEVSLDGSDDASVKFLQVQRIFSQLQASGQTVNIEALDRALLLADDLPGVAVAGALTAGQRDGETSLRIKLSAEPSMAGNVSLDNTGSRSTGSERLSTALYFNSLLGLGDLISGSVTHTQGSDYLRLGATVPVGNDGWRLGGSASTLTYSIISPEFVALQSLGNSTSMGLEASYPLVRARSHNLYLSLAHDIKTFRNESNAAVQSDYTSRNTSIGLSGNFFDSFGGGGANSASLALAAGNIALGTLDRSENAALEGGFNKLRYALTRQQTLTSEFSLYAALTGQHASQTLDSSEKFSLGGAGGVRAYPSSEGSGSSGRLLNLELRWRLTEGYNLTGFYDWGSISNSDGSASYSLQGAGLALNWQSNQGVSIKLVWAQRIGQNPNLTASGNDQDGSLNRNRWWLSVILPF